ncbi:MAG: SAM-dependent methyltransferase [Anaerolineales bacterium]|nr:SAM-dependent methyltransferase [Anaerolineales bacterium]
MNAISASAVAWVRNERLTPEDDDWEAVVSEIVLDPSLPAECLDGLEAFSHVEVIYHFHLVGEEQIISGTRRPRENSAWPQVGIFAQRARLRPNRLGVSVARLLRREGRSLFVRGLDALDGTPVLDLKPVMAEFLPRGEVRQPDWSHALMENYWERNG